MLPALFSQIIKRGSLTVIWPNGVKETYGIGAPYAAIKIYGRTTPWVIGIRPDPSFGEAYMDGRVTVEQGCIADVLEILLLNMGTGNVPPMLHASRKMRRWFRSITQLNDAAHARKHAEHHYDLSGELYSLFLDADRQYSCAYFRHPHMTLEEAQAAKKQHIAGKMHLDRPGLKVLDIGSGWGGLAITLAQTHKANVVGITLSAEQLALARRRAQAEGAASHCQFELTDYRSVEGPFDRIVSVGMLEHVGVKYYDTFFKKVNDLLASDGIALIHTIGRSDGPGVTPDWISKYIFPGGYAPALSEIIASVERVGLQATDIEIWRLHYAETLREWRARFDKNRAKAVALYDERFCRMWEFYLASAEMTFRYDHQVVFQIQLTKEAGTLPLSRDYMYRQS